MFIYLFINYYFFLINRSKLKRKFFFIIMRQILKTCSQKFKLYTIKKILSKQNFENQWKASIYILNMILIQPYVKDFFI